MTGQLKALLLDLDGTLLENDMDVFLPRYFELISRRAADIVPGQQFVRLLMAATGKMVQNDGRRTNQEVFAEAFYPALGRPRAEMEPIFEEFYRNEFSTLARYTRCLPEARVLVQSAFERGLQVVIATNPLFPAQAIEQRLTWAGVADFPYRLVTSYENSRACKPNPLYFTHILEELDVPPAAALVVGNEWVDMVAGRLGCPTFFLGDPALLAGHDLPAPTYSGTLHDLIGVLNAAS